MHGVVLRIAWLICALALIGAGCVAPGGVTSTERGVFQATVARRIMLTAPKTVESLSWSADGRRIAVGSTFDKRVGVYDVDSGAKVAGPSDRTGGVHAVAYSPDGRYLAIAHGRMEEDGQSYAASLWDPRTGAHIQNLVESRDEIKIFITRTLAFSPDSRYLAVSYQFTTFIYDMQTPGKARAVGRTLSGGALAFAPDSRRLAMPSVGGVSVVDVPSGRVVTTINEHPRDLTFSPDGALLIVTALSQARIYAVSTNDSLVEKGAVALEPDSTVTSVSVSPDSRFLALGGARRVTIFSLSNLATVATLAEHNDIIRGALFDPAGTSIAAFGGPTGPTIWHVQ